MSDLFDPLVAPFRLDGTNGEAVVMVHGFTGTPAHLRLIAPVLNEAGYTVEVPLLAGHGTSIDDMATTHGPDWLDSVRGAVARVEGHRRIHLFGFSMGGLLCLILGRQLRAASVTSLNAPIRFRNAQIHLSGLMHPFRKRIMWDDASTGAEPDLDPEALRLWLTYDGFPVRQSHELTRLARRAKKAATRLDAPTLVIQSREDESTHPESAEILCERLRRCTLVWLESSIHNSLLDRERQTIHEATLAHLGSA